MKLGECNFCARNFRGKSKGNCEAHIRKCEKFHKFVKGTNSNICALCKDNREFSGQGQVFSHLQKMHEKNGLLEIPDEGSVRACKGGRRYQESKDANVRRDRRPCAKSNQLEKIHEKHVDVDQRRSTRACKGRRYNEFKDTVGTGRRGRKPCAKSDQLEKIHEKHVDEDQRRSTRACKGRRYEEFKDRVGIGRRGCKPCAKSDQLEKMHEKHENQRRSTRACKGRRYEEFKDAVGTGRGG